MSRGSIKPHVAFNMLTANRKANIKAEGQFAVHVINKGNGKMRREPFADKTFKTKEEAEKQMKYWQELNPKTKFMIRSTNEPLPESRLINKIDMYLDEMQKPIPVISYDQTKRFEKILNTAGIDGSVNQVHYEPANQKGFPIHASLFVSIVGDFYKNDKIVKRLVASHFPGWKFAQSQYKSMRPDVPAVWEFWYEL